MEGYTFLNHYRYERKFVVNDSSAMRAEMVLKQNPALFRSIYKPRQINNIYFDSPGLECFYDNLFGNRERWKVRIRWYGETKGKIRQPILEYKLKKGLVGTKRSWPLASFEINGGFDGYALRDLILRSNIPDEQRHDLARLKPVLLNSYQRKYFISNDGLFRATIDQELRYYNLRSAWNMLYHAYEEHSKSVIELKYNQEYDTTASEITSAFPFRLDKNSKYATGMMYFNPGIAE